MAKIIAGIGSSHVPAIGAAIDNNKTEEPYWKRVFSGFEKSKEWMREDQAGRRHRGLQRPRLGVLGRDDPDLRARLRGGISARRRGLGPAAGAGGARAIPSSPRTSRSRSSSTSSISPSSTRWRSTTASPCRSTCCSARPKEWPCPVIPLAVNVVHVSAADRAPLLHARQGDPQGGRVLSRGPEGRDLRHRRHVAPDQRPARRPDQQQVGQGLPRQSHQGSEEAHAASRISNTCARPAPRASRW